jgi:hypothetical protein
MNEIYKTFAISKIVFTYMIMSFIMLYKKGGAVNETELKRGAVVDMVRFDPT